MLGSECTSGAGGVTAALTVSWVRSLVRVSSEVRGVPGFLYCLLFGHSVIRCPIRLQYLQCAWVLG